METEHSQISGTAITDQDDMPTIKEEPLEEPCEVSVKQEIEDETNMDDLEMKVLEEIEAIDRLKHPGFEVNEAVIKQEPDELEMKVAEEIKAMDRLRYLGLDVNEPNESQIKVVQGTETNSGHAEWDSSQNSIGFKVKEESSCNEYSDVETNEYNWKSFKKSEDGRYQCPECPKKYSSRSHLKQHIKNSHKGIRYECDICLKTYASQSHLNEHMATHSGMRYYCNACSKNFSAKDTLNKHMDIHKGVRYQCEECPKDFSTRKYLTQHQNAIHRGIRFQCNKCFRAYKLKKDLLAHTMLEHFGIRHPCSECPKTFASRHSLKNHILKIHKAVLYQCNECSTSKDYLTKRDLRRHMKLHFNGKRYHCTQCSKFYIQESDLMEHMAVHSGVRYLCPLCPKTFCSRQNMRNHVIKHEGEGISQSVLENMEFQTIQS